MVQEPNPTTLCPCFLFEFFNLADCVPYIDNPPPPFVCCSLCEKDCPIDMLELPNKSEKIVQVAWEPKVRRAMWLRVCVCVHVVCVCVSMWCEGV